ncbi:MAG TPA: ribbon-helix-helix protein, CopG family [Micromonosporaceae bacterium]|nr:ribbon-helix-helix protein, CopG family [Micromonosporaceae bacterium]
MSDAEFRQFRDALPRPDLRDMTPDQVSELLHSLTPVPGTAEQEGELAALLPPPGDPGALLNVVRSLRLPEDLNRRLEEAAEAEGIPASVLVRRAIESMLAGRVKTNLVNIDDVIRAVRSIPPATA